MNKHKDLKEHDQYQSNLENCGYTYLEKLGYSKVLLEKRIKLYDNAAKCIGRVTNRNWHDENVDVVVAGSRGEGLSNSFASDLDVIIVQPAVKCYHDTPTEHVDTQQYVFTFDVVEQDVPQGYVKLRLKSQKDDIKELEDYHILSKRIKRALTHQNYLENNKRLISPIENNGEGLKREGWLSYHFKNKSPSGPAQPLQYPLPFKDKYLSIDYVPAFICIYPSFFDKWCERVQIKTWPCQETIENIRRTDLFVVPVGLSGSAQEVLQWRVSFTLAEKLLVRSFNDSQVKAYAALKMLVKQKLKPICRHITSYLVKNLIFWVSEERNDILESISFYVILVDAMKKLKECVKSECLDNYIIPSRNLLLDRLSENEKNEMIPVLDQMCLNGLKAFQSCHLINIMCTLSGEYLEKRLLFRNLSNEFVMACFSIPPEDYDEIEHLIHRMKTRDVVLELYIRRILPIIKGTNPYECFPLLMSMKDEDVTRLLHEGFEKGYHRLWCN